MWRSLVFGPLGPEALQGVPVLGVNLDQFNMDSIGLPTLVFGPSGLRLSRAGVVLPGVRRVRPHGPEALQGVPALEISSDQFNSRAATSLRSIPTEMFITWATIGRNTLSDHWCRP